MKRTIIVEVLLLSVLSISIAGAAICFHRSFNLIPFIENGHLDEWAVDLFSDLCTLYKQIAILALVAALCDIAAMVLIALHNFPCFKPLIDKLAAKRAAQKQATATAKAEKAEADKQARIEQLTAELNELKKDE